MQDITVCLNDGYSLKPRRLDPTSGIMKRAKRALLWTGSVVVLLLVGTVITGRRDTPGATDHQ